MSPVVAWPSYKGQWQSQLSNAITESDVVVEPDETQYRLHLEDTGWRGITMDLAVWTSESKPTGIGELNGYALVACRGTNTRIPFRLVSDSSDIKTRFTGNIALARDVLDGTATLSVEIVAEIGGRTRVIGRAIPWTIVVRKFDAPRKSGQPPISQVWVDFDCAEAPAVARKNPRANAALDVALDTPVLYLNSGIPGLQAILMAEKPKMERRRLRDLLGSEIARYVASTLFRVAAAQVVAEDDEEPVGPTDPLLKATCESVAGAIPRFTSVDDLYTALARSTNRADFADLWADIDAAIDTLTDASAATSTATSEVRYA
ncbi:hypothetical protein [Gordonia sp. NPDC003429]